jgi:hypothetical protein
MSEGIGYEAKTEIEKVVLVAAKSAASRIFPSSATYESYTAHLAGDNELIKRIGVQFSGGYFLMVTIIRVSPRENIWKIDSIYARGHGTILSEEEIESFPSAEN